MLRRLLFFVMDRHASRACATLLRVHGTGAIHMARHAVLSAKERDRAGSWSRVLAELERRSRDRPW